MLEEGGKTKCAQKLSGEEFRAGILYYLLGVVIQGEEAAKEGIMR